MLSIRCEAGSSRIADCDDRFSGDKILLKHMVHVLHVPEEGFIKRASLASDTYGKILSISSFISVNSSIEKLVVAAYLSCHTHNHERSASRVVSHASILSPSNGSLPSPADV